MCMRFHFESTCMKSSRTIPVSALHHKAVSLVSISSVLVSAKPPGYIFSLLLRFPSWIQFCVQMPVLTGVKASSPRRGRSSLRHRWLAGLGKPQAWHRHLWPLGIPQNCSRPRFLFRSRAFSLLLKHHQHPASRRAPHKHRLSLKKRQQGQGTAVH